MPASTSPGPIWLSCSDFSCGGVLHKSHVLEHQVQIKVQIHPARNADDRTPIR